MTQRTSMVVPPRYDAAFVTDLVRRIAVLESMVYLRGGDVEIANIPKTGTGNRSPRLILRSPDGTRYSVTVDNAGVLATTAI